MRKFVYTVLQCCEAAFNLCALEMTLFIWLRNRLRIVVFVFQLCHDMDNTATQSIAHVNRSYNINTF